MRVPTTVSGSIKTLSTVGPDGTYAAFASFYELYNEKVYDLLEKPAKNGKRKELQGRFKFNSSLKMKLSNNFVPNL